MTRLFVNEVAPRDGLQMEKRFVPTHEKIAFVDALSDCGFAKIEVTSFTSPRAIPALADAETVLREIRRPAGGALPGITPSNAYACADGQAVLIAGNGDSIFKRLMLMIGRKDLAELRRNGVIE